ncbi:hypothetical protein [Deinococcus aquiradiocola]|uniref:YcaO domain-containing protein n=1 Tax=Deinococcus aquiradiocola TaxID=393059 RepID=A0A917ULR0_9DEIO|nr:hypothetical protein [Deinococcus aquiradiocola]GGJ67239.1 hypothetical protein GCM10008939_09380 [Deinococcus aquiradiocola]
MKPKFRRDVTYYRQDNGVAFHREGRWFQLDGPGLFEALERLTPRLDGTRELAELVAGMPPAAEHKLRRLIQILHKNSLLVDAADELPHTLPAALVLAFEAEIAFLDSHFGSGAARFQHLREQSVLVVGDPDFTPGQAVAFAQLGVRCTAVYPAPPPEACRWIEEALSDLRGRDPEVSITVGADLTVALQDADIVVVAPLSTAPAGYADVTTLLLNRSVWMMPIMVAGDEAWLGPIVRPSHTWIDWWAQLDPQFSEWGAADQPPSSEYWSPHTAGYLANVAAYDMMRWVCGSDEDRGKPHTLNVELETFRVNTLNLESLATTTTEYRDSADARQVRLEGLLHRPSLAPEHFARAAVSLIGDRGHVTEFGELNLTQLPLHVIKAQLGQGGPAVYGSGLSGAEARVKCMRRAIEHLQHRRFVQAEGPALMADVLSGDLLDCAPDLIDGTLVTASGDTWAQAEERALLRLYLTETLGGASPSLIRDMQPLDDPDARRLVRMLDLGDQDVQLWLCPNGLALPLSLVSLNGVMVSAAVAATLTEARRDSLMDAVQHLQARTSGEREYEPPRVTFGPVGDWASGPQEAAGDLRRRVAAALARRGRRCVTTPACTGPQLLSVLPFVAHAALLTSRPAGRMQVAR